MPTLKINDITMYYESHGKGDPLVLIAGVGTDYQAWMFQVPDFQKHFRILIFDNRGLGRTDRPPGKYSVAQMADDTLALMRAIPQAHLLGHSLGGFIAQHLAAEHPEMVKKLVLCCTSAKTPATTNFILNTWVLALQKKTDLEVYLRSAMSWIFSPRYFEDPTQVERFLYFALANPFPPTLHGLEGQAAAVLDYNGKNNLSKIQAPTLLIGARQDILLPLSSTLELSDKIAGSQLHVMESGGHAGLIEEASLYNKIILQFLKENS